MTGKKLDLVQLTSCLMAQQGARASKIMRGQLFDLREPRGIFDDLSKHLGSHALTPDFAEFVYGAEDAAL